MSASLSLQAASDRLLELAARSGMNHAESCATLLELLATGEAVDEVLRAELCKQEISLTGFGVLALLDRQRETSLGTSDLAQSLGVSAAAVSETLARLELAGLLTRVRRPDNRRHNIVELTAAGRQAVQSTLEHLEQRVHRLTLALSRDELSSLRDSCARLRPSVADL
ncbi:MarR family winged helix-turn-helix transcriptional regulator [Actomonas aquatica]|uniref:MarR family transcriptional regulator n=1 Tax=Actomonas aquatica TaxID=2866162 RepID=A0ABZ1CAD8_9BACT|nr:MarR family transcriptional regulator [Opitutus sp. WL0086]WRQ87285.1 MarR family transcriptional regulator [Opitutus sp. WL0086]